MTPKAKKVRKKRKKKPPASEVKETEVPEVEVEVAVAPDKPAVITLRGGASVGEDNTFLGRDIRPPRGALQLVLCTISTDRRAVSLCEKVSKWVHSKEGTASVSSCFKAMTMTGPRSPGELGKALICALENPSVFTWGKVLEHLFGLIGKTTGKAVTLALKEIRTWSTLSLTQFVDALKHSLGTEAGGVFMGRLHSHFTKTGEDACGANFLQDAWCMALFDDFELGVIDAFAEGTTLLKVLS